MDRIDLQQKTKAAPGWSEKYWFENELTGLKRTLFHRIIIPLEPFDSGLEYEEQPVQTEIVIEWLNLRLADPDDLDHLEITSEKCKDAEASVYAGCAHNACRINKLNFIKLDQNRYQVAGDLTVDFETEGVAQNETFLFQTIIEHRSGVVE